MLRMNKNRSAWIILTLVILVAGCGHVEDVPCKVVCTLKTGQVLEFLGRRPPVDIDGTWRIETTDGMTIRLPDESLLALQWQKEPANDQADD